MRLLFASIHGYLDPSSGAALATRELLELLAGRGMDCRALSAGVLDYERETALEEVLASLALPARRLQAELSGGRAAEVLDLTVNGVRVTLYPTASSRAERSPDQREGTVFLELADPVLDRFRPDVILTYGGHPASLELMRRARSRGIAVVFHLHNFCYRDRSAFVNSSAVIYPSALSAENQHKLRPRASFDSQDRVTTAANPDSSTVLRAYNSQGNRTSVTDERGNAATYSYDAMNRETGTTDDIHV